MGNLPLDAAVSIDNQIIGQEDLISYNAIDDLSKRLAEIAKPDNSYSALGPHITIIKGPVKEYFGEEFTGTKMKDLAERVVQISEDLEQLSTSGKLKQEKLREFCLSLSKKGFDMERWRMGRLVA